MSIPELDELKALAKTILYEANKKGLLHKTTHRMVREKIESRLSLEPKVLDAPQYRKPLKEAVEAYIDTIKGEESQINGQADEEVQVSPKTNRLSKPKTNKVKEEEDYVEDEEEDEGKAKKKKASSKKRKEQPETERPSKKRKSGKENGKNASKKVSEKAEGKKKVNDKFKSAELIPSSDAEDDAAMQVDSTGKAQSEDLSSADEGTSTLKPSSSKAKSSTPKNNKVSKVNSEPGPTKDEDSDTGLSDLIDEPPKKKSKSKNVTKASGKRKEKASNKKELSKDEETIKRLKGFINACGVRKVWSKLFDGIEDQPSKQIKMLRKMLEDLGMEGRPSMEKAKAIKAKRELEDELAEVQAFEKAVKKQGTRSSETAEAEESEESASEEDERPAKRKTNARQSIMAFLADQSDSE